MATSKAPSAIRIIPRSSHPGSPAADVRGCWGACEGAPAPHAEAGGAPGEEGGGWGAAYEEAAGGGRELGAVRATTVPQPGQNRSFGANGWLQFAQYETLIGRRA